MYWSRMLACVAIKFYESCKQAAYICDTLLCYYSSLLAWIFYWKQQGNIGLEE